MKNEEAKLKKEHDRKNEEIKLTSQWHHWHAKYIFLPSSTFLCSVIEPFLLRSFMKLKDHGSCAAEIEGHTGSTIWACYRGREARRQGRHLQES